MTPKCYTCREIIHMNQRNGSSKQVGFLFSLLLVFNLLVFSAAAQQMTPGLLDAMHWRLIGPFRGGRVTSVSGVPSQPSVYYMGTPGGGVWKTEDGGQVWKPIFDHEDVSSIGAVAVSPSNPQIVYVGSGEQTQGDGVYKSTDAGETWLNIGLRDTHVITSLVIDPHNPDVVLAGAAGDRTSGAERGVYKTADGGKSWQKVLFKDEHTSVADLESDPDNPNTIYAALWTRPADPFNPEGARKTKEQDGAIYVSTDEGTTWSAVEGKELPRDPMGRIGVAVAPGTHGQRVYAIVTQGLFQSEDGGATWRRSTADPRITGNGYFSRVFVDARNADKVYVAQTAMYRSTDAGRTFEGWVGAPSGDDFHVLWINPLDDRQMILGVDQGAIVSVDSGASWSSWYNQPTGQFYHVSTDQKFPYYVYGAQQDSGTAGVPSRSDFGEITYRDWAPVGGFEFAYIVPDPANSNYIYTGGWYGTVLRFDRATGQIVHLFVRTPKYRTAQMAPIGFAPQDPHTLYVGSQFVLKSRDGGVTWKEISPDLTQKPEPAAKTEPGAKPEPPKEKKPNPRTAVITTMSFSPLKRDEMWVGTGNGMVQVTRDGKSWQNVSIPKLPERAMVTMVEASAHDPAGTYVVIQVRGELHPSLYRTRDYGQSWQLITAGLPSQQNVRVVRDDPARKGLLYGGTDKGIYVSFDDGDHWQSLQLNLPVCPITDLDVHGDDLVASTFGRSFWILDDVAPLRQLDDKLLQSPVTLLPPPAAIRARWDMNQDTPLPPETPAGKNPPEGAIIDYFLKDAPRGDIKLSIYDSENNLVREFTDVPPAFDKTPPNIPNYWFAKPPSLSKKAGLNRFAWDLRYPAPKTLTYGYFNEHLDYIEYTLADHAIPGDFPHEQPLGAYVVPDTYSLVLTVNGQSYRQPLTVTLDPRVHTSQADLVQQVQTEKNISALMAITYDGYGKLRALREAIADREKSVASDPAKKDAAEALKALDEKVSEIENGGDEFGVGPLNRESVRYATMVESGDARPAAPLQEGVRQNCQTLIKRVSEWRELSEKNIPPVNDLLRKYNLPTIETTAPASPSCESH
ncbi:MAG TPA: hypothetical protein VIW68_04225 [Candidatus Sulfotelmatobacter sp.]